MNNVLSNETLIKQFNAIAKAGNNVTLRDDNARAFIMDTIASSATLAKLGSYFAKSGAGSIDKLGVKKRTLKLHQGINTKPDGTDIAEESSVPFRLVAVYMDTWIENSNTFYTARTRGQDVRQALLALMQQQYAADLQDLSFNGDEASSDAFLKLNDGFIKQAKATAKAKYLDKEDYPTIRELTEMTGDIADEDINESFKWVMSRSTNLHYVAEVQNRQTNLGDAAIVNGQLTNIGGFGVEVVDNYPRNVIMFTPLENLTVVHGLNVTLTTAAQDSAAVAKQATYHFLLDDKDFIIRNTDMLLYIDVKPAEETPEG